MAEGIQDKVVVITGASSGLGEATARLLASKGAKVVLGARRVERIEALAGDLVRAGGSAISKQTDVTSQEDVEALVELAIETYGRVDVIVNNAGLMPKPLLGLLKVGDWERMIDVNLKGVLYGIASVLPKMQAQKSGHIINVSSVSGHKVTPGTAVYAATKHGVRVITEGLRQEVTSYNIRTTILSPGAIATELPDSVTDEATAAGIKEFYKIAIPPESFARMVAFAIEQPEEVDVNEILFRPTAQEY